jgi:nicotinic acid mononucleotide adenylyltransferase
MASLRSETFIFTIARMNPPTPGHMFLIRTLIHKALEKGVEHVYVFLSKSRNNDKDPLACPDKEAFLTGMGHTMIQSEKHLMILEDKSLKRAIDAIQVHVICVPEKQHSGEREPTPVSELMKTVGANPRISELIFIVGEDREKEFGDSIKKIFSKWDSIKGVEVIGLKREGMNALVQSSKAASSGRPSVGAISASYVRNLARHILFAEDAKAKASHTKEFHDLYEPYLDKKKIDELYQAIVDGFARPANKPEAKSRSRSKSKAEPKSKAKTKTKSKSRSRSRSGSTSRKASPKGGTTRKNKI